MAYLKAAGKAIINSPKAIRKKLGGTGHESVQKHEREKICYLAIASYRNNIISLSVYC